MFPPESARARHDAANMMSSLGLSNFDRPVESPDPTSHRGGELTPVWSARPAFANWGVVLTTRRMTARLDLCFQRLASDHRAALVTYVMAGDPDPETSSAILAALPAAGADVVELGIPFTDPVADGPAIQAAGRRALDAHQTLQRTLEMAKSFRATAPDTPLILMGYYNPIYAYGVETFLTDAKEAGVDGLIVVDCPPEEDDEVCLPARRAGLAFIRLIAPTTDERRLPIVLSNATGFVYFVSITGVTGSAAPNAGLVREAVARLKRHTKSAGRGRVRG